MQEEWRDIAGYEGRYKVSNTGKVLSLNYRKSKREKALAQEMVKGYYCVHLCKEGRSKCVRVSRLVALAFIPNPPQ